MYSYPAIVIGLVHSFIPYIILTCYLSLQAIDGSLLEAARSLGASRLTTFRRITFPLSLPGLVVGAVLIFVPVTGSFMEPRILGGKSGMMLGTVIEDQFTEVFNWPLGSSPFLHPPRHRALHPGAVAAADPIARQRLREANDRRRAIRRSQLSHADAGLPLSLPAPIAIMIAMAFNEFSASL